MLLLHSGWPGTSDCWCWGVLGRRLLSINWNWQRNLTGPFLLLFCGLGHFAISGTYWLIDSLQSLLPALTCEILPERAKLIKAIEPYYTCNRKCNCMDQTKHHNEETKQICWNPMEAGIYFNCLERESHIWDATNTKKNILWAGSRLGNHQAELEASKKPPLSRVLHSYPWNGTVFVQFPYLC